MRKIEGEKRILFKGRFTTVLEYDLVDEGKEGVLKYECVDRGDSVAAVVYNAETKNYYFVKQYRIGAQQEVVELVAGMFNRETETPEDAICREIEEEIGYSVKKSSLKLINTFYTSPGGLAEKMYLYYAETNQQLNDGGGIEDENLTIITMTKSELLKTEFFDAKTIIGCDFVKVMSEG